MSGFTIFVIFKDGALLKLNQNLFLCELNGTKQTKVGSWKKNLKVRSSA